MSSINKGISRRDFIKSTTVATLALTGGTTLRSGTVQAGGKSPSASGKLALKVAGYKLDRVDALIDGRVQIEGCDMQFEAASIGDINTNVFSGPQSYDVTEIGQSRESGGGIRVNAFVRWPDTIEAGSVAGDMIHVSDLYTTFARIAQATEYVPRDRVVDGIDQSALLLMGDGKGRRDYLHMY